MNSEATIAPFGAPLYVMPKPAGASCNLACEYCYYLEKKGLYPAEPKQLMSDALLEKFIQEYLQSQTMSEVSFTWHGGEPLLRSIGFYKKALALQREYGRGRHIENCIQTNGTLLNDEWCRFFRENNFLVGVSIDGPKEFHDEYRIAKGGQPTFARVMKGISLLKKHGVDWNAMAVVNDYNADFPLEFYKFFRDELGCQYLQFTPVVERVGAADPLTATASDARPEANPLKLLSGPQKGGEVAPFSVSAEQWGDFLCAIFDEWVRHDVGKMFVQTFDATLANWVGVPPGVCSLSKTCGHAGVMEFNGDVYSCDHFVFPEYKLGNIHTHTLVEMMYGQAQQRFGQMKTELPSTCLCCEFEFACHGECPRNRFLSSPSGEQGLNYLCKGYRKFFQHAAPAMEFMKREYLAGRDPSGVMKAIL